ncbi:hypothetical protein [Variovorax sp. DAIF25]|uniref:hypothetical protein n=1 Tax=Variovorax sp. DAIF25 TaxID=3080983 RepID=UPI003D6ADA2C
MNRMTDLAIIRRADALQALAEKRRQDMKRRWPEVDFDAEIWPIKTLYDTRLLDVRFGPTIANFAGKDDSYVLALRCLIASAALEGKSKSWQRGFEAWRLLATSPVSMSALHRQHLHRLEADEIEKATPESASACSQRLGLLSRQLDELAREGVVDRLMWNPSIEAKGALRKLTQQQRKAFQNAKGGVLDRQIEALSEATAAMLRGDRRLSTADRSAIAVANILMCAPSRINEPLTLKISDRYTLENFVERVSDQASSDDLYRAHQLLFMKGSKGAQASAKPILNFMIDLTEQCWQILLDHGKRSRAIVAWYELHPDQLYLPAVLDHLRGRPLSAREIWQIVNVTAEEPTHTDLTSTYQSILRPLNKPKDGTVPVEFVEIDNPRSTRNDGYKNGITKLQALPWQAVETLLLKQVKSRLARLRKVTPLTRYEGVLSEMLMLVDRDQTPYLPQAWDDRAIRDRLKQRGGKRQADPCVFIKLGLRMTQGNKEVNCYLEPHDTRRWLTSQALLASERLSDVLINKWANRLCVGQLDHYDFRTDEQKADQAAMPAPRELVELSKGLQALEGLESQYGLSAQVVVAHGEGIAVTSLEEICQATDDRPVARTGGQLIILYPTRFGMCLHQHHETPCRSYSCPGCDNQVAVKGHMPTNEEWRKEAELTNRSIVNQLQNLLTARNRGIADDLEALDAHLLTLIGKGLDPQAMTSDLIQKFHEVKDRIRDPNFKRSLERAFVAKNVVARLDDPEVTSGALIKYHNASQHSAPGHERAIESHFGTREAMDRQSETFYKEHSEFAPAQLGLRDEGHLLADSKDGDEDVYEQAA